MPDWPQLQTLPHCSIPAYHHTDQAYLASLLGRHYPAYYFFRSHDHLLALMVRLPRRVGLGIRFSVSHLALNHPRSVRDLLPLGVFIQVAILTQLS